MSDVQRDGTMGDQMQERSSAVLVVGAGVGGIRAALDLAESGYTVYLADRKPNVGGTLVQLDKWFPDNHCGLCKMLPTFFRDSSLQSCLRQGLIHPNIVPLPLSEVQGVEGEAGNFTVTVKLTPSGVDSELCIGCGLCEQVCPEEAPSEFNQGLEKRKAIYRWHPLLLSGSYTVDWQTCTRCGACVEKCPTKAINLTGDEETRTLNVGAVILSTGFEEYDASLASQYGHGRYPNVVTSIELERMLSATGPTDGKLERPSDKAIPRSVAFLQCVGSRDTTRDYCSSACCMYAVKEAGLLKDANPDLDISIFFMDIRAFGKGYYRYYQEAKEKKGVNFVRSRVPVVKQDPATKELIISAVAEDGGRTTRRFDMVVLSVGQTPSPQFSELAGALGVETDRFGFCHGGGLVPVRTNRDGIYVCGSASSPKDIADTLVEASGAAACVSSLLRKGAAEPAEEEAPRGAAQEDPRTAVLVCRCSENGPSHEDIEQLLGYSRTLTGVSGAEEVSDLCMADGPGKIRERVKAMGANRVLLTACVPFLHKNLHGDLAKKLDINPALLDTISLREEAAVAVNGDRQAAVKREKAMIAAAVERLRLQGPLYRSLTNGVRAALVIGGGLAGLTAALSLADRGVLVDLVEKSAELGGYAAGAGKTLEGEDPAVLLRDLVQRAEGDPQLTIYREAEVANVTGYAGNFEVALRRAGEVEPLLRRVGAVIIASGGGEATPQEYLYGESDRVLTQTELERKIASGEIDPVGLNTVAFIQCVGSRDEERPYCSRVCCATALKNALYLKEKNPRANVFILYRDLTSYGLTEQYYSLAREKGVIFIRYDLDGKPRVNQEGGKLNLQVTEPALGGAVVIEPDLLVLSPALVPGDHAALAAMFGLELNEDGFFKEAEVKFRPVDFLKAGIYVCGLAHSPRNMSETIVQALAAAQRAASLLAHGSLVSGRVVSEVNERRCSGCEICVAVCPYEARVKNEESGVVEVREALCQGCGACAAACPSGAAKLRSFSDKQLLSMVDVIV